VFTGAPSRYPAGGAAQEARVEAVSLEEAAARIAQARLGRLRLARLEPALRPADEAAAYAVQDALHERLAAGGCGPISGWKIGCTTEVMQRYLGIHNPCAGGIFTPTVHRGHASLRHADFLCPGVECEIAVRLGADLGPAGAPHDRDKVARAVAACMAAIEIVDDRYEDYRSSDTPTLIADDFFGAGCVLGPPAPGWGELDLASLSGRMLINSREVGAGSGADILGHPFEALAWLANAMARRGRILRAGEIVLLGSVVQTVWVRPRDEVAVEIAGLGSAAASFA